MIVILLLGNSMILYFDNLKDNSNMKVFLLQLALILFSSSGMAQTIGFTLTDPQPDLLEVYGGSFASGDLDGDGDNDLIMNGLDPGRNTAMYLNDGSGIFTEVLDLPFPEASSGVTILKDLDADGDLDLFFSGIGFSIGDFAHIYLNDGSGGFTQEANPAIPQFSGKGAAIGDVDNDGDPDILISAMDTNGDFVADMYLNDGNAHFTPSGNTVFIPVKFASVALIDVENDGDADVFISGVQENENALTRLYINDGTGNFSADDANEFVQLEADDVDVLDSDNDGDFDLLLSGRTNLSEIRTILYINNGDGQFTESATANFQQTFAGTNASADLDNDGDQDIVVIGSQDGGIPNIYNIVYENLGNNVFLPADTIGGEYIAACVIDDFSGDGLSDIIVQGFIDQTNFYLNASIPTSLDMLNSTQPLTIYPNPSTGQITIQQQDDLSSSIKIYSLTGKLVYRNDHLNSTESVQLNLPVGFYLAVSKQQNTTQTQKLIITD